MKRIFAVLVALLLWHSPASAEDLYYYWTVTGSQEHYPSAKQSCEAWFSRLSPNTQDKGPMYMAFDNETTARCRLTYSSSFATAVRSGMGCAPGSTYDPSTGGCSAPEPPEEDKCASTYGKTIDHEFNRGPVDDSSVRNNPPPEVCQNECQYVLTDIVRTCKRFNEGENLTDVFCVVAYEGNGNSCTAGNPAPGSVFDQPPSKPPTKADPTFAKDSKCGDWETQADGTQTRSCNSTEESKQPGKVDCSGDSCKAGVPPPDYSKTDVKQNIEKKPNPDGSTTTKTDTTTDKTSCKGVKPCTSTSKTETTTSEEDAEGKPGDSSYECTGAGCDKDGGEDEGEEGPEREASVGTCDAGFSCSGDAIDCEILRQQKEQLCLAQEMTDFEKHKPGIEATVTGDKFELNEGNGVIDVPSFVNQGTRFLPSTCPAAEKFSLTMAGGRSFEISYEPLCRAASDLSGLFVAVATVLAALYVGRSVGGQ
ncbi:virulence factor TspB C-terminal domain-related protein [Stutzerimonas nitrititolerans]|uniref:virulence factor TspB C-terminal domain-related protein n=1 Tax=Stutzerimonas nitrititolerans TaxID=2482751 RepID=UPI0028970965|nr:virulence factor TspB C-terminal domain-related protein [Stutzerimonas nitrititolerans]